MLFRSGGEFTGDHGGTPWSSITLLRQILVDWASTKKFDTYLNSGTSVIDTEKDTITVGVGSTWVIVSSTDVITYASGASASNVAKRTNIV